MAILNDPWTEVIKKAAEKENGSNTEYRLKTFNKGQLVDVDWDFVALTQTSTEDTYTFKDGGSGGTTVAVVTITYTDSSKATIDNVERTT